MESFFPVFFILFVVLLTQKRINQQIGQIIRRRRKEHKTMDNSILSRYIGKECVIQANGYVAGIVGKVTEVSGNWISVEDKKGKLITFNCDYISSIKEK